MSDTSFPNYMHYGTHAQRLAFTPSPSTGQPIYLWYETDTGQTFLYDTSWHQITSSGTLPATVQGDILYASGVNTVVALNKNTTATRYLSNTGSSNNPAWAQVNAANGVTGVLPGLNGGGLVLLEQHTASGSSTLDFTTAITSTYDTYQIEIVSLLPNTNAAAVQLLVSTDGGANYAATSYLSALQFMALSTAFGVGQGGGTTGVNLNATFGTGVTRAVLSGFVKMFDPGNASTNKLFDVNTVAANSDGKWYSFKGGAIYDSATAVNAFQIKPSAGNFTSGIVRCYGIAKT